MNKPNKPTPDFPLFAHSNGQWAKKIKGKTRYFGLWDDPQGALERYLALFSKSSRKCQKSTPKKSLPAKSSDVKDDGKPGKPYPEFPLYSHRVRQWAKKIRGRTHFFGPWHDPHGALCRYLTQKDDLEAGRQPAQEVETDGELTVKQMVYLFLASKKLKVEAGEMARASWKNYESFGDRMIRVFGANTLVSSLGPVDFQKYRADLQRTHKSLESIKSALCKTKAFFNWAGPGPRSQGYLERLPRLGDAFVPPSRTALQIAREEKGGRVLTADQIRLLLDNAKTKL